MPVYLSASSIADFVRCPQMVFYRINKPFPTSLTRESIMGEVVHKVVEKAWNDRSKATQLFAQLCRENRATQSEVTNYGFALDLFFLNFASQLTTEDTIEYSFKVPLYDDVFIVGKMDRISKGRIYDWKTGNVSKNTSSNVQCIIYEYAYEALFKKKPDEVLIASLKDGQIYPYMRNEFYRKELFEGVIPAMIQSLRNNNFSRMGVFSNSCARCYYKSGCLKEA